MSETLKSPLQNGSEDFKLFVPVESSSSDSSESSESEDESEKENGRPTSVPEPLRETDLLRSHTGKRRKRNWSGSSSSCDMRELGGSVKRKRKKLRREHRIHSMQKAS